MSSVRGVHVVDVLGGAMRRLSVAVALAVGAVAALGVTSALAAPPASTPRLVAMASDARALVALAASPQAHAAATLTPPSVALPPDLLTLEQRAQALHVDSIRFTALVEVGISEKAFGGKGNGSLTLPIEGAGEASVTPEEAWMTAGIFGMGEETRVIGHTVYTHSSSAAKIDKGRPWVRSKSSSLGSAGIDPLTVGGRTIDKSSLGTQEEAVTQAESGPFDAIFEAFASASKVTEIGPEIVNGGQATEFSATLNVRRLLASVSGKLLKEVHKLGGASAEMYVSFAPDGLPLRTAWTVAAHGLRLATTVDILATEVPVSVKAPPAGKMIGAGRLHKLEKAKLRLARERLKACSKQRGRLKGRRRRRFSMGRCMATAKAGSR